MELTQQQSLHTKAIAILMMLFLLLFNHTDYSLYEPLTFIAGKSLSLHLSYFAQGCVPIYLFLSGYGLYISYSKKAAEYSHGNRSGILKLFLNFWVILVLFVCILGPLMQVPGFPGSLTRFLLNFTAVKADYNGAWWFFTIYIILTLLSPFLFRLVDRTPILLIIPVSLGAYLIGFYMRFWMPPATGSPVQIWLTTYGGLLLHSFFPFVMGAVFYKMKIYSGFNRWLQKSISKRSWRNILLLSAILFFVVFHAIVPSFLITPFVMIPFIMCFNALGIWGMMERLLGFLGFHSTNMWLVHMFIYLTFFREFIFSFKYALPIFAALVIVSIIFSYVINVLVIPLQKKIKI